MDNGILKKIGKKKGGYMMMKIIIFVAFIASSAAYGMDKMWTDLVICSNQIKEKTQERDKLNDEIDKLKFRQKIEHQRVIHRGLEPEPLKAKL